MGNRLTDPPSLLLVLYGHPWVLDMLNEPSPFAPFDRDLLVELAPQSVLGPAIATGPTGSDVLSVLGAAAPCPTRTARLPAPILLAPAQPASRAAVIAAAAVLKSLPGDHRAVTALMHIDDLRSLTPVAGIADRIAVYWDLADRPSASFPDVGRLLADEGVAERFVGLHLYQHPRRALREPRFVRSGWDAVLADYQQTEAR